MDTYQDLRRQLRNASILIMIIVPIGVVGFMVFERLDFLDAIWITVITLATIGYGDLTAQTVEGRFFTMGLIFVGLGSFAYAAQAAIAFLLSPAIADIRLGRRDARRLARFEKHYIICGEGELIDRTVETVLHRFRAVRSERLGHALEQLKQRVPAFLHPASAWLYRLSNRADDLMDTVVVITQSVPYAQRLRREGIPVIVGDPSEDTVLQVANLQHAAALMAMSSSDTESLLTVLAARSKHRDLLIIAATHDDSFASKMLRAGANNVITPLEVAGQFLNNATFRPAVNDLFSWMFFERGTRTQVVQLFLYDESPWIGKSLQDLTLSQRFGAHVVGIRRADGSFVYAPASTYELAEEEVVIAVVPLVRALELERTCMPTGAARVHPAHWQRLPLVAAVAESRKRYSLVEAEEAIAQMSQHYIICSGSATVARAVSRLNPERPFVIISSENDQTSTLLRRGFRVIHGSPTDELVLRKAGIQRALAIMISLDDRAASVLTTLSARSMSRRALITVTADEDEMIVKLQRAGADRVVNPYRIAAQAVLLATLRPTVNEFLQYILFNPLVGLETTELYMQDDSPWIGKTLGELHLDRIFRAGVIAIRQSSGEFVFAPQQEYRIGQNEVIIVTVPMSQSDSLREIAHGSITKRPKTLRHEDLLKSSIWNQ